MTWFRFTSIPLIGKVVLAFLGMLLLLVGFGRLMVSGGGEPGPLVRPFLTAEVARPAAARVPEGDPGRLIPGVFAVHDVHATADGWTLLDRTGGAVSFVDSAGVPGGAEGRYGQGPGELERPGEVAGLGDRVAVLDQTGTRLDILARDSTAPVRLELEAPDCRGTLARDLASDRDGWIVLRRCLGTPNATTEVLRVSPKLAVSVLAREPLDGAAGLDPLLVELLAVTADGIYLGSSRAPCLRRIEGTGPVRICMPSLPLAPLPDEIRDRFDATLARARSVGMEVELPESVPAQLAVRPLAGDRWAVVRMERDGSDVWMLERREGSRIRIVPEAGVDVEPGPAGVLLLRHEPEGLRAWVIPFPVPDR